MKSFVLAFAAMIAISVGAAAILNASFQKDAGRAFTTSGARIGATH